MTLVFRGRVFRQSYEDLFRPKKPATGPVENVIRRIARAYNTVWAIARHFGDRSNVWYDFGYPPLNYAGTWRMF